MVTIKEIEQAAIRLENVIHRNPAVSTQTFSDMANTTLFLKYENQQKTGSFKVRGAYNKIAALIERGQKPEAVVASSAGNHAQGVAYAAKKAGIKATIVMPRSTPIAKVLATKAYGAEVVLFGDCYDDAYEKAMEIQRETGARFLHPFNDEDVIAGQGTIALEILQDLPTVDMVVIPAGGGGLLAGMACCIKEINPRIQVVGVQAEGASAIVQSFYEQNEGVLSLDTVRTIADGIAVKTPGELSMAMIRQYVDDMVTVSDEEIAATILLLMERNKQVVEPSGAASLAAVTSGRLETEGKKVVCLLSGGNIDVSFIHRIIEKGLVKRGRRIKLRSILLDIPGSLEYYAGIVARCGANVVAVEYDRTNVSLRMDQVILEVSCEVSGPEMGREVVRQLENSGFSTTLNENKKQEGG